jgi:hypothetical protein
MREGPGRASRSRSASTEAQGGSLAESHCSSRHCAGFGLGRLQTKHVEREGHDQAEQEDVAQRQVLIDTRGP